MKILLGVSTGGTIGAYVGFIDASCNGGSPLDGAVNGFLSGTIGGAVGIKSDILSNARCKYGKEFSALGTNPDVAFAPDGTIGLVSRINGKILPTDFNINNYRKDKNKCLLI